MALSLEGIVPTDSYLLVLGSPAARAGPKPGYHVAGVMAKITMYTTEWCGYCERAKALLERKGLPYEEIRVDEQPDFRTKTHEMTGG